jgi:hypothetical protein
VSPLVDADDRLLAWAEAAVSPAPVTLEPPGDVATGQGASLYLLELAAAPPMRGERRPPVQLALRYLVTTWAAEARQAHQLLGQLVLAALTSEELEAELAPPAAELWTALPLVRHPLVVRAAPGVAHSRPKEE